VYQKRELISLQIGWTTSMGTIKKRRGGKKVFATGWMNNIHGKNQKAQKKLSCDRMEDIYGNN
jgi:hypothetical protein